MQNDSILKTLFRSLRHGLHPGADERHELAGPE
jgi:hypothetical protein